jgi:hypothetical protein
MKMASCQSSLVPEDEQVIVTIGPAELWCFGGTIAEPSTGPLVQGVVTDQKAKAVVDDHPVRVGDSSLEVRVSPLEESEEEPEP